MIEFRDVHGGFGGRQVLDGVSFAAPAGKITALVGPNGCGKSTLLSTACGLLRPSSGQVLICGRNVEDYGRKELARQVALLPQSRSIPAITVGRLAAHGRYPHLGFGRELAAHDRELIARALQESGAWELRERELSALSGGERQRAYIAMALAQDSAALLLDEPTTYLDIDQKYQVMELIRRLHSRGKTVLAVLHDLELAFRFSDLIAVMEAGKLVAFGRPEEVCDEVARVFGVRQTAIEVDGERHFIFY